MSHPTAPAGSVTVVVPAFNERSKVRYVVECLVAAEYLTIVVDDGSRDGTGRAALSAGATVLRHPINRGQGAALQTGLTYALSRPVEYIATFDADGQHDVADLARMIAALERTGVDIALGSRFLGKAVDIPRSRRILLKLAAKFTTLTEGLRLTDAHNGLRVMRRAAASKLQIRQDRMAHASELIGQIRRLGLTHVEVPVTVRYTRYSLGKGQSGRSALGIVYQLFTGRLG